MISLIRRYQTIFCLILRSITKTFIINDSFWDTNSRLSSAHDYYFFPFLLVRIFLKNVYFSPFSIIICLNIFRIFWHCFSLFYLFTHLFFLAFLFFTRVQVWCQQGNFFFWQYLFCKNSISFFQLMVKGRNFFFIYYSFL